MVHLLEDGVSNVVVAIVFAVLDTIAVILRIIAKRKTKLRFGWDDAWILCALVLFYVWAAIVIHCECNCRYRETSLMYHLAACFLRGTLDPVNLYYTHITDEEATEVFLVIISVIQRTLNIIKD